MKKKIIKYVITIIILGCIGLFFYSYIGIDKETGVPKGLLMRIRPLPWEEIYWDEDKQLLKLTVEDETFEEEMANNIKIFDSEIDKATNDFTSAPTILSVNNVAISDFNAFKA